MNEDMSQFLGVFLDEATEQLELLEQAILRLEQQSSQQLLQEIFRAAHTLKGSSRAMGFTAMGELTHAMEDVFDKMRHEELSAGSELINALFAALDALKTMKEEVANSGTSTLDTTRQTERLRAVLTLKEEANPNASILLPPSSFVLTATQQDTVEAAQAAGCDVCCLTIRLASDCVMKSVRVMMALQAMEHIGSVLATMPDEEALENEEFESEFVVLLATEQGTEDVCKAVNCVNEVAEVRISGWQDDAKESSPAEAPAEEKSVSAPSPLPPLIQEERISDLGPEARSRGDEPQKAAAEKRAPAQSQTVRVDVSRLDKLLNLVGELVIDRTRLAQLGGQFQQKVALNDLIESLHETAGHIGLITDELQNEIMKARMLPIDNVFNRFPRMVRDLAQKLDKEIQFVVEGNETELDRSVIEVIGDPLIHMLRNSVDHGIETPEARVKAGKPAAGTVWLRARHQENHIVIEIQDDGKGMDPEKLRAAAVKKGLLTPEAAARLTDKEAIQLIFASGFSMAATVSEVSGRGVGMDIVKSNIQRLGGQIEIESRLGSGSVFTVRLPLTLAIIRALLVTVRDSIYAIPLASVVETLKIKQEDIHLVNHQEVILQRGKALPIVRMRTLFHLDEAVTPAERVLNSSYPQRAEQEKPASDALLSTASGTQTADRLYLVVVGLADNQVGLAVDRLIGEQEVVIKTLGKFIGDVKGLSGATILGDGRVALIVDVNGIIQISLDEKGRAYAA